ncbi:MAG: V-type ATP synthase alpha chain [Chlamydiae bacterium]|nr:V-type ATP synthase alpha chain [Chlamydiota bacterium]
MTQDTTGTVVKAFGNLLQVRFEGNIRQGEVAMIEVGEQRLKAEVIEIVGDEAKLQVYEDTRGIGLGTKVVFQGDLLEAELGPGLLQCVVDGLQNPLERLAEETGLFLTRGVYIPAIDRKKEWDYKPVAKVGDVLKRGDTLGTTKETHFDHHIMIPFSIHTKITLTEVTTAGKYTVDHVVAKGKDDRGNEHTFTMIQKWPVKNALIEGTKVKASKMMSCGLRIIDTQFPLVQGGTFCTPGPFGAGKTVLQHHLSKFSKVDIVVVAACGERAGEVVEILKEFPHLDDPNSDGALMERTVIICNTSSMPVAARESSIYLGVTIAEYYRQMGLNVLLLADSTSRWAQALREMSGRLEEIPGEEAFPAYLASRIAAFYERAGAVELGSNKIGSVTIGGAVSPAGGNFEEPVTQATLAVVGAFLGLSRARSDARRYPAIDPLMSWSKYVDIVSKDLDVEFPSWAQKIYQADRTLLEGDEIGKRMEVIGEEGTAIEDFITYLKGELYDFSYLQQNAFDVEDSFCPLSRQLILFKLICEIFETAFEFSSHDEARGYFLKLQNSLKNLNFTPFESEKYNQIMTEIRSHLDEAKKQGVVA